MLSEKQCEELREMWCGEDDADTSYAYEDIPLLLNTIDELRAQATADAAAWAKVREALSSLVLRRPIFLREWGAMLRRQGYELAADVFRAIADALEAEAQADAAKEATDG